MINKFEVVFLEKAREFLLQLDEKVRNKIFYTIDRAKLSNDPRLLKKLTEEIWEFRTEYGGIQYRLLAFWDKTRHSFVVATHGFIKKTEKTPSKELRQAESLRRLYFQQKENESKR